MNVRVKICGITSPEDAHAAVRAGADALGFMFYKPSPRYVTPEQAAGIIDKLPPHMAKVGVFVDADEVTVRDTASNAGLDTLQFHGNEPPEFCEQFELRTIKAFRLKNLETLDQLPAYDTDAWLLDSYVKDMPGGTGKTFNWNLAVKAKRLGRPILLAGGLTPDNAEQAVHRGMAATSSPTEIQRELAALYVGERYELRVPQSDNVDAAAVAFSPSDGGLWRVTEVTLHLSRAFATVGLTLVSQHAGTAHWAAALPPPPRLPLRLVHLRTHRMVASGTTDGRSR